GRKSVSVRTAHPSGGLRSDDRALEKPAGYRRHRYSISAQAGRYSRHGPLERGHLENETGGKEKADARVSSRESRRNRRQDRYGHQRRRQDLRRVAVVVRAGPSRPSRGGCNAWILDGKGFENRFSRRSRLDRRSRVRRIRRPKLGAFGGDGTRFPAEGARTFEVPIQVSTRTRRPRSGPADDLGLHQARPRCPEAQADPTGRSSSGMISPP